MSRRRVRPVFRAIRTPITNQVGTSPRVEARARAREAMNAEHTPWYRIGNYGNNASKTADVYLYSEIGMWGTTADEFVKELNSIRGDTINLRINSEGGEVFDGITIFNALRNHAATVNVTVDGLAASAASFIAMAGDTITMDRGSQMMIHDAQSVTYGNAGAMRECADLLDKASNTIASLYAERAGGTVESWRKTMAKDTWYTAEEAVAAGLADSCVSAKVKDDPPEEQDDSGAGRAPTNAEDSPKVLAHVVDVPESSCSSGGEPAPIVFDVEAFRVSMRAGTAPPAPAFDVELFRAAMYLGVTDVGAPPLTQPSPMAAAEPFLVDPSVFRRALREAKL